jgi:hypothetical protein
MQWYSVAVAAAVIGIGMAKVMGIPIEPPAHSLEVASMAQLACMPAFLNRCIRRGLPSRAYCITACTAILGVNSFLGAPTLAQLQTAVFLLGCLLSEPAQQAAIMASNAVRDEKNARDTAIFSNEAMNNAFKEIFSPEGLKMSAAECHVLGSVLLGSKEAHLGGKETWLYSLGLAVLTLSNFARLMPNDNPILHTTLNLTVFLGIALSNGIAFQRNTMQENNLTAAVSNVINTFGYINSQNPLGQFTLGLGNSLLVLSMNGLKGEQLLKMLKGKADTER